VRQRLLGHRRDQLAARLLPRSNDSVHVEAINRASVVVGDFLEQFVGLQQERVDGVGAYAAT
jgi:hypothetical protein